MKINIYYGGRGIIDDPTLFVLSKMTEVLKELNVQVTQYNLYEQKTGITALAGTIKDADGIILASTVEWFGTGGYLLQLLDSCWLYGDKEKISKLYMMPVVMSTTYGERDGMMNLASAWEVLGGLPCDGLCGYIADTSTLENNPDYITLIEKRTENLYRTINQKTPSLPASNQAVKKKISLTKSTNLTPQESEQLSKYVSDEAYVQKQKEDIQELSNFFRTQMKKEESGGNIDQYLEKLRSGFKATPGVKGTYSISITDQGASSIFIEVNGADCKVAEGVPSGVSVEVILQVTKEKLADILAGRMTFQRAFMSGDMKVKGEFQKLRSLDQIFPFIESA